MKATSPLLLIAVLLACASVVPRPAYYSRLANVTSYDVKTPKITPGGIRFGGDLDPLFLDRVTRQVASCLAQVREPTTEEKVILDCPLAAIRRDVDPKAFDVFVPKDWRPSLNDPQEQVLPAPADSKLCFSPPPVGKGLKCEVPPCECNFRVAVQDNRTVVTPPNLKLFPEALVRLVTACNYVWAPPLSECARPPM